MGYDVNSRPEQYYKPKTNRDDYILHPKEMLTPKPLKKTKFRKLYTAVPAHQMPVNERWSREQGFVLDGVAVNNFSLDLSQLNPKLAPAIPPYNAQTDPECAEYFKFGFVSRLLRKTGQKSRELKKGTSTMGEYVDKFHSRQYQDYFDRRNKYGAGHDRSTVHGHDHDLRNARPLIGYNGNFGFRRNTPWLRYNPYIMGPTCPFATY